MSSKAGLLIALALLSWIGVVFPQAQAAIALRNKSFSWSGSSTSSITPSEPTGTAPGDILIMFVVLNNNVGMSTSAEWNDITAQFLGTSGVKMGLFWARRGGDCSQLHRHPFRCDKLS